MVKVIFLLCFLNLTVDSYKRYDPLDDVFTNLSVALAQSYTNGLSSSVSLGSLPGIKLGSAGAQVGNDVGASTSFGLSRTQAADIFLGVSAAQSKTANAISRVFHSRMGGGSIATGHRKEKRWAASSATSLNALSGPGTGGIMGSTGVQAGPVATAISLGSLLAQLDHSLSSINAGATAAHAGQTDSSTTFSNSNLDSDVDDDKHHNDGSHEGDPSSLSTDP